MSDIQLIETEANSGNDLSNREIRMPVRNNVPSAQEISGETIREPIRTGIAESFTTTAGVTRATRKPLRITNVLSLPERPGFVRFFINDIGDNVQRMIENGYQYVTDATLRIGADDRVNQASGMASSVISRKDKSGVEMFAMEIPKEWYDDNQRIKREERERTREMYFSPDEKAGQYMPDVRNLL